MFRFQRSWVLGAAAVGATVLWFALLAGRPLFDPDEGRYAEIPREMLLDGDWVIPHLNALAYLEKPPLQYWLTALSFGGFGQSEFTARLTTGIAGFLSLVAVFFLARALWGREAGLRALLFTSASTLFVLLGHQLTLDMLLSFCLVAALGCFLMAQTRPEALGRRRVWMLGCWASMALAVLAKGLVGVLIPAATLALYIFWQRDWRLLRRLEFARGLPLFAAIAVPWFVMAARANSRFLNFFFVREHFQRFLTPIEHRTQPWWFFAPVLAVGIMPWLPQAAGALISPSTGGRPRDEFDARRVLWIWCVFVLIFFSASDSKLIPYILPAVPALALLCAGREAADSRRNLLAGAFLSLGAGFGVAAYASGRWISEESRELLLLIRPVLFGTCALLILGGLLCAALALANRPRAALAGVCAAWFLAAGTILIAGDAAQSLFSAKDIALLLQRRAEAADPIFAVEAYEQSLPFYLRRAVVLVDYRDEFELGLGQDPGRGIPTLQQFARVWQPLSEGIAVMPRRTRDRLAAMGVPMREIARFPDRVVISRE